MQEFFFISEEYILNTLLSSFYNIELLKGLINYLYKESLLFSFSNYCYLIQRHLHDLWSSY